MKHQPRIHQEMHAALPPELKAQGVRVLHTANDATALTKLLEACYGKSYFHRGFYNPETIQEFWLDGTLLSLGYSKIPHGPLLGHTAFWLQDLPNGAVTSGLSLVHPEARGDDRAVHDQTLWSFLLPFWSQRITAIHQNTTTLHPLAQRYASHYMRARPAGFLMHYTEGEKLAGLPSAPPVMHALSMITHLKEPQRAPVLPHGPWGDWLERFWKLHAPQSTPERVPLDHSRAYRSLDLVQTGWNAGMGISRRRLVGFDPSFSGPLSPGCARLDLIHVPTHSPEKLSRGTAALLEASYLPVGLHFLPQEPPEIVFQYIPNLQKAARSTRIMHIADVQVFELCKTWSNQCAHTS